MNSAKTPESARLPFKEKENQCQTYVKYAQTVVFLATLERMTMLFANATHHKHQ